MKRIFLLSMLFFAFASKARLQQVFTASEKLADLEKDQFRNSHLVTNLSVSSNNFDVYHYRCEWNVDPAVRYISGKVTTSFSITATTNNIVFDLTKVLTVDSVLYRNSKISFQQNSNDGLQINFPGLLSNGQKDSVSIYYKGAPPFSGFGSFAQTTHSNIPVLWTLSEPYGAKDWWPCKDVLKDKADSIDIVITYPLGYRSSSNGLPVNEKVIGDKKIDHWKHRYPIASYLVAIAVTNYNLDNDEVQLGSRKMPVVMYAYPESVATFKNATNIAKNSLQLFSGLIGEYPFIQERYAQTQFSRGGGMEHQTNSFISSAGTQLVSHELAHQWFGDKITCASWEDLWLNEGFATYFEFIYIENFNKPNIFPHLKNLQNIIVSKPDGSVFVPDTANLNRLFDSRLSYLKGGYLLHMLRGRLGDSTFFRGVRQYLNDPALQYKNATTADLQRNLEQVSSQNLSEFFKDWYKGEGYPNYVAEWSQNTSKTIIIKLNQTTSHPSVSFYEMPVQLQFKNSVRDTIITVNHNQNGQTFIFNPGFVADTLIIDPNLWILAKERTSKKVVSSVNLNEIIVFPNPLTNLLSVSLSNFSPGTIHLQAVNSLGQIMITRTITSGTGYERIDIGTTNWPTGVYWLRLNTDNGFKTVKKLIKY